LVLIDEYDTDKKFVSKWGEFCDIIWTAWAYGTKLLPHHQTFAIAGQPDGISLVQVISFVVLHVPDVENQRRYIVGTCREYSE